LNEKTINQSIENKEFQEIIKDLVDNKRVQEMKEYRQHYNISCYTHCYEAAYYCYKLCKKWNWDYKSATRGAMLHDMFLYDWRKHQDEYKGFHAFHHGRIAYNKASKEFELNDIEKNMILRHMFPVTPIPPKYKEGWLLTIVDKYCTMAECFEYYFGDGKNKKM